MEFVKIVWNLPYIYFYHKNQFLQGRIQQIFYHAHQHLKSCKILFLIGFYEGSTQQTFGSNLNRYREAVNFSPCIGLIHLKSLE
jgi:hypothetical protein